MPYVKLDCGMLDSSLWNYRLDREMFITALLMAKPKDLNETLDTFDRAGRLQQFKVPPGENYGFVEASGSGIARRALVFGIDDTDAAQAMDVESYGWEDALASLASPDTQSRTPDFEGRRMVRVAGGFIILNYGLYREKDSSTERVRRHRERKRNETRCNADGVTETVNSYGNGPETEAEALINKKEENQFELKHLTDAQFYQHYRENPKYAHVDFDDQIKRMKKWYKERGTKPNRENFVSWIDNVRIPMELPDKKNDDRNIVTDY